MRARLGCVVVVFIACNGSNASKPATPAIASQPATTASPTNPAELVDAPTNRFVLGEATVFELGNPEKPVFKLHADGRMEFFHSSRKNPNGSWSGGGVLKDDGTIDIGVALGADEPQPKIVPHGVMESGPEYNRTTMIVEGNSMTIKFPPELPDVRVALADDGKLTLSGDRTTKMGTRFRVEAADRAVQRTAFIAFAWTLSSSLD